MENWWNTNLPNDLTNFAQAIGDHTAPSKIHVRKYVISKGYKSILDAGCGLCSEFEGYKKDGYEINYFGIDFCDYLIELAKSKAIPVMKSSIEEISIQNDCFEVVYGRHILEHQSHYLRPLNEFLRIAQKEVIIVFFIWPQDERLSYDPKNNLYNNQYALKDIVYSLLENPKVKSVEFERVAHEIIMHVHLTEKKL